MLQAFEYFPYASCPKSVEVDLVVFGAGTNRIFSTGYFRWIGYSDFPQPEIFKESDYPIIGEQNKEEDDHVMDDVTKKLIFLE